MNEAETRADCIDPALKAAGWGVAEGSRIRREYPITLGRLEGQGRRAKPLTADYLLIYRNTSLAIVDARNVRNIVLLRPINSMIEFKQIVGRGTRLYDGKDYFTIYDFVKAHQHFSDPEWDGEPVPPEEPAVRRRPGGEPPAPAETGAVVDSPPRTRLKVKLGDGKVRTIQHMMVTTFWHPDGTPMSAQQFLEMLFGKLPEFFRDEDELRALWSAPDTRFKLLQGLAEKGFGGEQLAEMQRIIDAEKSDLYERP